MAYSIMIINRSMIAHKVILYLSEFYNLNYPYFIIYLSYVQF